MPAMLKHIPTVLLISLLVLAIPLWSPAQDAVDQEASPLPRFIRCTERDDGQLWLHEELPAGTQVEFLPWNGSNRVTVTVPENARYIAGSPYHLSMTNLTLEPDLRREPLPLAVMPPGLPFEDLPLEPLPQGADPIPQATQALAADLPHEAGRQVSLDISQLSAVAHRNLEQDGVPLDVLYYETEEPRGYCQLAYIVLQSPTSFKAMALGAVCDTRQYKLFRLNGVLYIMTQFQCCACGYEYFAINAFQDGEFVTVYSNADWAD